MDILNTEYQYRTKEEFELLTATIQNEIDDNNLFRYIDQAWTGRNRRPDWRGEYVSIKGRKIFLFDGNYDESTLGALNYKGNWSIIRCEETKDDIKIYKSQYRIKYQEPCIFAHINFEVAYEAMVQTSILIDWEFEKEINGSNHSSLIKSTVEFGIISAFEDLNPETGHYLIKIKDLRYHPVDTSFTLLYFVSNRNLKRALFKEGEDFYPSIDGVEIIRKFRPFQTVGMFNNRH